MDKGENKWDRVLRVIEKGGLAVIPTDTLLGIVAKADNKKAVEFLYSVRGRNPLKPCIVLCASTDDLVSLRVEISAEESKILSRIWPNPVSVVLTCKGDDMKYLHRGTGTLAIRIPQNEELLEFLRKSGPIIAPSANKEGLPPATNIAEAKRYFGESVGIYVPGKVTNEPSTLIEIKKGKVKILRPGAWKMPDELASSVQL